MMRLRRNKYLASLILVLLLMGQIKAYSSVARPEEYGAKGDGVTDDTKAVQMAIDASSELILNGTYRCHLLIIDHDIVVNGGTLKSFLDEGGNTTPLLRSKGEFNLVFNNVIFDGSVSERGTKAVDSQLFLEFECQNSVCFYGCTIRNHGIVSKSFADCWYLRKNYALRVLGANKVEFNYCEFYANREECICIGSNNNVTSKNQMTKLDVSNCISHDGNKDGSQALFLLFNLKSGSFKDCHFKDQGTAFINNMSSNVSVEHCTFENTPNRAITSEDIGAYYNCRNIRIINNTILNCHEAAISVGNKDILIKGNVIENCGIIASVYVGGLICGENPYGSLAKKAIPYFDGAYDSNKYGSNIRIENNIIGESPQIGILIYCNYLSKMESIAIQEFGMFSKVRISNNVIKDAITPIQFSNGHYQKISITNNRLAVKDGIPILLTTSDSPRIKGFFSELTIENNDVISEKPLNFLIFVTNAEIDKLRVKNNSSNYLSTKEINI